MQFHHAGLACAMHRASSSGRCVLQFHHAGAACIFIMHVHHAVSSCRCSIQMQGAGCNSGAGLPRSHQWRCKGWTAGGAGCLQPPTPPCSSFQRSHRSVLAKSPCPLSHSQLPHSGWVLMMQWHTQKTWHLWWWNRCWTGRWLLWPRPPVHHAEIETQAWCNMTYEAQLCRPLPLQGWYATIEYIAGHVDDTAQNPAPSQWTC